MTRAFASLAFSLALVAVSTSASAKPLELPPTAVARGKKGVVVSAHPDASRAGVAVLRAGGNAMDAAVATAFALSVIEPYSAGLGGGGFLIHYDPSTQKATVVDYREVAPKAAQRDMYIVNGKVDPDLSVDGILAVAVPGMVPGLALAQSKLGKKKLSDVLDPAIALARDGFLIYPSLYEEVHFKLDAFRKNAEASKTFLVDNEPVPIGARFKQPVLAATLTELKTAGPKLFTEGRVAKAMAAESARLGGKLTLEDLRRSKPRIREPLVGQYRGYTVITMPPPSSGGIHLLQMLGMLELDRKKRGRSDDMSVGDVHARTEIMRRAYADRAAYLGDPAFVKIPTGLLEPAYLERRFLEIDWKHATPSSKVEGGLGPVQEPEHTTHLTVIDADGQVVVLTQTINTTFGSGVVVPHTGIVLNNEMDDFAAAPGVPNAFGLVGGEANSIQPGKIPLSSMTPTIVLSKDKKVRLALGAPGGATIITTVLQVILHVIDRDMDVAHAVAAPRIHHQWKPDELRVERGALPPEVVAALEKMGHTIHVKSSTWGNATAIEVLPDGTRVGAADPRAEGGGDAE